MKKSVQTIFNYPPQILQEYSTLMSTKESFLRKITSAEARRLEALYAELKTCWETNLTKKLNDQLDQKYNLLRTIQKEIESDWQSYENNMAIQELKDITNEEQALKQKREKNKKITQSWKQDILTREGNLLTSKNQSNLLQTESYKESKEKNPQYLLLSKKLSELLKTNKELMRSQKIVSEEYTMLQIDLEKTIQPMRADFEKKNKELSANSQNLTILLELYQQNLKTKMRLSNEAYNYNRNKLEKKKKLLMEEEKNLQLDLENYEQKLIKDISKLEQSYLNKQRLGIYQFLETNLPNNIKSILKSEKQETIISKLSMFSNELKKESEAKLKKINLTLQEFLNESTDNGNGAISE